MSKAKKTARHAQVEAIARAYDRTVDNHKNGIRDEDLLPEEFSKSPAFVRMSRAGYVCNSGAADIREFLSPMKRMKFLDVGCCANLTNYLLHKWPSAYYGIDVSAKLVSAMRGYCDRNGIVIGDLREAETGAIPFPDCYFDIASCIGVLEYFDMAYIAKSLSELHRVLKPQGRLVLDMPNPENPDTATMIKMETYLGRGRGEVPPTAAFEKAANMLFRITAKNDSSLMIKYFLTRKD